MALSSSAFAARSEGLPNSRYDDTRASAMGDSTLALVDAPMESLFANPAGIAKTREASFELLNVRASGTQDFFANFGTSSYKVTSLSSAAPALGEAAGSNQGAGLQLAPGIGFRGFAMGVLYSRDFAAISDNGNIRYHSRYQLIPAAGVGVRLASGVIRLGYSFQYVNLAAGQLQKSESDSTLAYNDGIKQGSAFSHNAAFALTFPFEYLPSFALVARNIGGAKYRETMLYKMARNPSSTLPATEKMSLDLGVLFQPKIGGGGLFNFTGEYKDILLSSKTPLLSRLAAGIEFNFRESFFLRGGLGYGYPHAGIGLKTKKSEFSISWSSDELSTSYRSEREIKMNFHYQKRVF